MHNYLDFNHINVFIGGILLVLSIVMFMIPIRDSERWHNFRTGRNTLAIAYIVLGVLMVVNGALGGGSDDSSGMITLVVSFFQALLYTKICVLFLKPRSFDNSEYKTLLIAYGVFSTALVTSYIASKAIFTWLFYIGIGFYALLLIYCTLVFIKCYNTTSKRLEYVYDEDMYYRLRWVKGCFYSALLVGVMAWFMSVFYNSVTLNIIGIFIYTIYYLCMVGYFMRYISNYDFILKSDVGEAAPPNLLSAGSKPIIQDRQLADNLKRWVEQKKYRYCNKTMDDIAEELGTTRSALNEYMNNNHGMSFRAWRNTIRIEEAKRLLSGTDTPLADIVAIVGYSDRSNFHRYFTEATGLTPIQYRNKHKR